MIDYQIQDDSVQPRIEAGAGEGVQPEDVLYGAHEGFGGDVVRVFLIADLHHSQLEELRVVAFVQDLEGVELTPRGSMHEGGVGCILRGSPTVQ